MNKEQQVRQLEASILELIDIRNWLVEEGTLMWDIEEKEIEKGD